MSSLFSHPDPHEARTPDPSAEAAGTPSYTGLFQEPTKPTGEEESVPATEATR
jgi:hypothetical protein